LNAVFLISAPVETMRGEVEIGYVVAGYLLGDTGATIVAVILAGVLISTVSAMVLAGPRALMRLGGDYPRFKWLGTLSDDGLPKNAVIFMGGIALLFLWSSTFEQILIFAGLLMAANTFVTVIALFISRRKFRRPLDDSLYQMPLYPLPALIFLGITGWTLAYSAFSFPTQVAVFAAALIAGWPLYRWARHEA
jgi:APA family basic amino acid/polyamine antiporter